MCDTNVFDHHMYHPANTIIFGSSQAGKSQLVAKLLRRRHEVMSPVPNKIIYCYGERQPQLFDDLKRDIEADSAGEITFVKGLEYDIPEENTTPIILVIDDLMDVASKNKELVDLFTRGSHHRSISLLLLVQNFFFPNMRTITLNCKYILAFKNPRDSTVISFIGRQMNGGKSHKLLEYAYKHSTSKPYGYIFLDLSQTQDERYRIRSSIFADEDCVVYTDPSYGK